MKHAPEIFGFIEVDEVRERLTNSEERIRRAYKELFSGYSLRAEDVLNEVVRVNKYTGIIVVENISFYTFCEHHFLPFFGHASVSYQPGEIITGLGKVVRLVRDVHARRLQIQEVMTKSIAEDIMRVLGAEGCLVETTAKHLCICGRGPGDDGATTTVRFGLGTLERFAVVGGAPYGTSAGRAGEP